MVMERFQSFREIRFFLREVGVRPHRGGSSLKVSTKRGNSYLCKLPREGSHTFFKIFKMRLDKLPKNTGNRLPKGFGQVIIIAFWMWNPPK